MTSHQAHCPSCAQTIHFPVIRCPVREPAALMVRCPNCRSSLQVWLDQLAEFSSPDHPSRPELSQVSPRHRVGGFQGFGFSSSGDTRVSTAVCSHCRREVTEYRFAAGDGLSIVTYHCAEHGDVIPPHGVGALDAPLPRYA